LLKIRNFDQLIDEKLKLLEIVPERAMKPDPVGVIPENGVDT
jgi:hypothetical protein